MWEIADGGGAAKARLMEKGFQGSKLKLGLAETSGCVILRPSQLQVA